MSLKPTKKSDSGKDWLKGREAHSKIVKLNPEYHLIVTEGTDTEPFYFEGIKKEINANYRDRISLIIEGKGDNTVNLFTKAKKMAENNPNNIRHVWIIYDTDEFPAENVNKVVDLCQKNTTPEIEYHAIWSNQCIEIWFLLHFEFYQSDIHRTEYWPKLSAYLNTIHCGDYVKNRENMYAILKPYVGKAIENARKLNERNNGKPAAASAPGTQVYRIIEHLKPYLQIQE